MLLSKFFKSLFQKALWETIDNEHKIIDHKVLL